MCIKVFASLFFRVYLHAVFIYVCTAYSALVLEVVFARCSGLVITSRVNLWQQIKARSALS